MYFHGETSEYLVLLVSKGRTMGREMGKPKNQGKWQFTQDMRSVARHILEQNAGGTIQVTYTEGYLFVSSR